MNGACLIELSEGWLLVSVGGGGETRQQRIDATDNPTDGATDSAIIAKQIRDTLAEWKSSFRLVIAPDSPSCYFVPIDSDGSYSLRDRGLMTFEMEASLPFDAELGVVDFSLREGSVSGIAIEKAKWNPIVDAIESEGISVESITPFMLLAIDQMIARKQITQSGTVIWSREGCYDLIQFNDQHVSGWRYVRRGSQRLAAELAAISKPSSELVWVNQPELQTGDAVLSIDETEHAAIATQRILSNRSSPWYELRRDELAAGDPLRVYRGPLRLLAFAAAVFLMTVIGGSLWRQSRAESAMTHYREEQQNAFKTAFPGSRLPAALMSRIRSEHRKALGARQGLAGKNASDLAVPQDAIPAIEAMLKGLPDDVRFRITQASILNGEFRADVQLKSHDDAGRLAAALEKHGFSMQPPGTETADNKTIVSELQGSFDALTQADTQQSNGKSKGGS